METHGPPAPSPRFRATRACSSRSQETLFAIAATLVSQVYLLGQNIVYLRVSEGLDASGTWQVEFKAEGDGPKAAVLVLEMTKDGKVSGTLTVDNPMDGSKVKADVEGQLAKDQLELECTLDFGQFKIGATLTATLAGDALDGEGSFKMPEASAPMKQTFHAKRTPK